MTLNYYQRRVDCIGILSPQHDLEKFFLEVGKGTGPLVYWMHELPLSIRCRTLKRSDGVPSCLPTHLLVSAIPTAHIPKCCLLQPSQKPPLYFHNRPHPRVTLFTKPNYGPLNLRFFSCSACYVLHIKFRLQSDVQIPLCHSVGSWKNLCIQILIK